MKCKQLLLLFFAICFYNVSSAQDSTLLNLLSDSMNANKQTSYVTGSFKGLHVINMQTVEAPAKGALNFIIMHRFGKLNDGAYNFFGLDNATIRLGLDYGITDDLAIGIGRSSFEKTFDGYAKYKILRQTEGSNATPLSLSLLAGITQYTIKVSDKPYLSSKYRTSYFLQALLSRKFNSKFSLQLSPTWLHYNLVPATRDKNDMYALGMGARYKITKRMSINAEYNYVPPGQLVSFTRHNSLSLGLDIETGGHVFQLIFTNSAAITEPQYIGQTTGSWGNGDIFFGFNVSRIFNISKHSKYATSPK